MNRMAFATLVISLALTTSGCGDDDGTSGTDSGPMTVRDSGPMTGTDSGPTGTDSGPMGTDSGPTGTDSGPTGTDSGPTGPSAAAEAFCTGYETTCGFGAARRHADRATCLAAYDSYDLARQMCVANHLGFAGTNADMHCPHATGEAPCN